ncbi:MAG TPA: FdtA/QdtA family cupin domain-containing protein [Candidatus Wallbacteria bacterium]|nr:MAG: TDP-4-oxo-6-deoxy-alpha-D-glucose-3,4-oxoisomerase [bacterium ADurb.Bin243]HOD41114.1 FdtA/QdtA family cupin domain-containing protein [Candidatus Wallbacteria bacterium]HPG58203.1 FdtA/QdtA family cupin domain-containing protein [Candidatus Wallbacteria bacterium]
MARLIKLKSNSDVRGNLTVIEKILPFDIKRIFYIYGVENPSIKRGGHRHKNTIQALISVAGSCVVDTDDGREKKTYLLDSPEQCLILEPEDWHIMKAFTKDCVLLVLASEYYNPEDYVREEYK